MRQRRDGGGGGARAGGDGGVCALAGAASRSVVSAVAASGWYQWHAALFCAVSVTARTARKKKIQRLSIIVACAYHTFDVYISRKESLSLSPTNNLVHLWTMVGGKICMSNVWIGRNYFRVQL